MDSTSSPQIRTGDTVKVSYKIKEEGNRSQAGFVGNRGREDFPDLFSEYREN